MLLKYLPALCLLLVSISSFAQQEQDPSFDISLVNKAYPDRDGPTVFIDEGHHNFHTADGRYGPFAKVLRADGYEVKGLDSDFSSSILNGKEILVIANALHESNDGNWDVPNPSAFDDDEIEALKDWVNEGGAMFLIADHMPFSGAAERLAESFGVKFFNGFAGRSADQIGQIEFTAWDGVGKHPITDGRDGSELIDTIKTFVGSAFAIPSGAQPLLFFPEGYQIFLTEKAWEFEGVDVLPLDGFCQGAAFDYGKGKVVIFGEAAMFSAQVSGPNKAPMGMNSPGAHQNAQLLLNIVHWLDGLYEE